jgi:hypothetical protein
MNATREHTMGMDDKAKNAAEKAKGRSARR